jgi:hypothetical protein
LTELEFYNSNKFLLVQTTKQKTEKLEKESEQKKEKPSPTRLA